LALRWLVDAAALLLIARFIPGFQVRDFFAALLAVLIIGLINATLGLFLKILTIPLAALTRGISCFVVDALVIYLAGTMVPGFAVTGFAPAFIAALILAVIQMLLDGLRVEAQSGAGPGRPSSFSITLSLRRPWT
jgi:putative membrane protein